MSASKNCIAQDAVSYVLPNKDSDLSDPDL